MSFPANYNTSKIKSKIKTYRIKQELQQAGITNAKTSFGNEVRTYCIERTLCDISKPRNLVDMQIVTEAFKRYAKSNKRNIPLLSEYARLLRVENKVRTYLEVLI